MKIGCMVYAVGDLYEWISECAVKSFKKYHPDIKVHHVTSENIDTFEVTKDFDTKYKGRHEVFRWAVALEIWEKYQYDKMILLGADTITCAYLSEFIDDNISDAILTLDEAYQLTIDCVPRDPETGDVLSHLPVRTIHTPMVFGFSDMPGAQQLYLGDVTKGVKLSKQPSRVEYTHCNSDVSCFNNANCLRDLSEYYFRYMEDHKFMIGKVKDFINVPPDKVLPPEKYKEKNDELDSWCAVRYGLACYNEQGALNVLLIASMCKVNGAYLANAEFYGYEKLLDYNVGIADKPYSLPGYPGVIYNVRSHKSDLWIQREISLRNQGLKPMIPKGLSVNKFKIIDHKLLTEDDCQIKVWHYGRGLLNPLGTPSREKVASFILDKFNNKTLGFFKQECDCEDFFEELGAS